MLQQQTTFKPSWSRTRPKPQVEEVKPVKVEKVTNTNKLESFKTQAELPDLSSLTVEDLLELSKLLLNKISDITISIRVLEKTVLHLVMAVDKLNLKVSGISLTEAISEIRSNYKNKYQRRHRGSLKRLTRLVLHYLSAYIRNQELIDSEIEKEEMNKQYSMMKKIEIAYNQPLKIPNDCDILELTDCILERLKRPYCPVYLFEKWKCIVESITLETDARYNSDGVLLVVVKGMLSTQGSNYARKSALVRAIKYIRQYINDLNEFDKSMKPA